MALAVVVGAVQVVGTTFAGLHQPAARPLDALGLVLLVAGGGALAWRRRWPEVVLAATSLAGLSYRLLGYPNGPIYLGMIVAFFTCALVGRRWFAYGVLGLGYVTFVWAVPLLRGASVTSAAAVGTGAWMLVLLAAAEGIRQRRAAIRAGRARAAEAARSRDEEQRRRASEERLDIARELHDVLAHSLSMINVQSGVALELIDQRPEQARQALDAIKTASRDALVEVQGVLDSLRRKGEGLPSAPAPSVADLDAVVGRARAAGLRVRTLVDGDPAPLPSRVDLAAARIVQEALTNVARHAGGAPAEVTLRYSAGALEVQVDDHGPGPMVRAGAAGGRGTGDGGGGNGIPGMRARASALGGSLAAGPRPGGGFRVRARLPPRAGAVAASTEPGHTRGERR